MVAIPWLPSLVWVCLLIVACECSTSVPTLAPTSGGQRVHVVSFTQQSSTRDSLSGNTTNIFQVTLQAVNGTSWTVLQESSCSDAGDGCQYCRMDLDENWVYDQYWAFDDDDHVLVSASVGCSGYHDPHKELAVFWSAPASLKSWYGVCINFLSDYCGSGPGCGVYGIQFLDYTVCPKKLSTLDRAHMGNSDGSCPSGELAIAGGGLCGDTTGCGSVTCSAGSGFYLHEAYADDQQGFERYRSTCSSFYDHPVEQVPWQQTIICAPSPPSGNCHSGPVTIHSWGLGSTCTPYPGAPQAGLIHQGTIRADGVVGDVPTCQWNYHSSIYNVPDGIRRGISCDPAICPAVSALLKRPSYYQITDPYGQPVNPSLSSPAQSRLVIQCPPGFTIRDFPDGHAQEDYTFYCDGATGNWYNFERQYNWNATTDGLIMDCHKPKCTQPFQDPHGQYHKNIDTNTIVTDNDILDGDTLWLACDVDFYPSPMDTRCGGDGLGDYDDPIPQCLPLPKWQASNRTTAFYDYDIQPIPPWSNYTRVVSYDVEYGLLFPTGATTLKSSLSTANGVTQSFNTTFLGSQYPQLDPRIRFITDENNAIAHVISQVRIRPTIGNVHSSRTLQAPWDNLTHPSPCGCTPNNPTGAPLSPTVVPDLLDNSISIQFHPDSLCTSRYRVTGDSDKLDKPVSYVDSYDAITAASCSLLTPVTQAVSKVHWNMHGRSLRYCIEPLPRRVCETCTQFYGQGDDIYPTPSVCFNHTAAFVVVVSGRLSAAAGGASQLHLDLIATQQTVGIRNANVTGMLVQVNNISQPFLDMDGNIVTATTMSDDRGNYELILSSTRINASSPTDQYRILITPSKVDSLPPIVNDARHMRALLTPLADGRIKPQHQFTIVATHRANGTQRVLPHDEFLSHPAYELDELYSDLQTIDLTFPHTFQDVSPIDDGNTTSTALVTHGSVLTGVDFYDVSVAWLSGTIIAPPKPAGWKGGWIENCGVPDVKVEAVTDMGIPVDSRITDNYGAYVVTGPIFQHVKITMSSVNNNPNHKFSPESFTFYVDASDKKLPDITFLSVNNVSLTVAGGLELLPVGLVVPRLILPTCSNGRFLSYIELPSFSDLPNTTYSVPALHYQLEVDNSPGDGSWGLQIDTPQNGNDGYGPSYASSSVRWTNVHTWLQTQSNPAIDVELRQLEKNFTNLFQYFATPEISLLRPDPNSLCSDDPSKSRFTAMKARSYALVQFVASATYGRADPRPCANVATSIDVIDFVTDLNNPVHVTLSTVYSNETFHSVASYGFITGDIDLDPQIDHQAPPYSRQLQYRLSGTSTQTIPPSILNVVLYGKLGIGGARPAIFPPYEAMYILRDPPGGSSFAELEVGSSISVDIVGTTGFKHSETFTHEGGPAFEQELHLGLGASKLAVKAEGSVAAPGISGGYSHSAESQNQETRTLKHTLTQSVTTSTDPTIINGDGDMFLTVSGSYRVQDANEILFNRDPLIPTMCNVTLTQSSTWDMDPSYTMEWISRTVIENVVIPGLRGSLKALYRNYGIDPPIHSTDLNSFRQLLYLSNNNNGSQVTINNSTLKQAFDLQSGAAGWEKLLNDSIEIASNAIPWPVLFQPVIGPVSVSEPTLDPHDDTGVADGSLTSDQLIHLASDAEIAQRTGNALNITGDKPKIGSITFYGGMQTQSYALQTSIDHEVTDSQENHDGGTVTTGTETTFGADVGWKEVAKLEAELDSTKSSERTPGNGLDNSITIHLGDPDQGDQFQMEVLRDMVYGGFVYKLVDGQSRCAWEPPTQPRDRFEVNILPRDFSAMSIHDVITTQLHITNTNNLEDLNAAVSLGLEQNYGLRVSIDGQVVNWLGGSIQYASPSGSNSAIQVTVPKNNSIDLLLVVERGPSPIYKFSIPITVAAVSMGGANCLYQTQYINIEYEQPTATVEIVSPIASFIHNMDSSKSPSIVLRNPEHYAKGRTWLEFYNSSLNSPLIEVQYRWQGIIPGSAATSPYTTIFNSSAVIQAAVENDIHHRAVIVYDWDVTNLPDGVYEVRARTFYSSPDGSLDPTPFEHVTTPIIARIDHHRPALFGLPTPPPLHLASHPADLSEPIQVTFTEEISCDGQFDSKLTATMSLVTDSSKSWKLVIHCDSASGQTKLTLALPTDETVFASLNGETVNVMVVGVVDLAGNGMDPNPIPPTNSFSWIFGYANVSDTQINVPPTSNPTADPLAAIIPELAITPIPVVQPTNVTLQWQQGQMTRGAPSFVISYHRLLDRTWIDPEMQEILFSANPHYQIQIDQTTSSQVAQAQCIETDSQSDDSPPAFTCSVTLLDWMPPSYADYVLASPKDAARITFAKYLATAGDNQWQFDVSQAMTGGGGDGPPRLFDRYSTAFYFTSTPTAVVIKNVSQITACASCTSPDPTFQVNPYSGTAVHIQWVAPLSNGLNSDRYNDTSLGYQISVQVMGSGATFVLNQWIWDSSVQTAQASSGGRVMHIQSHGHTKRHPIGARSPSSRKGVFVDFAQNPDLAYVLNSLPLGGQVVLQVLLTSNSTVGSSARASFPIVWYAPLEPAQVLHVEQSNYNVVWYPDTFINDNSSSLYYTVWMSAPTIYTTFDSSRWSFGYINFANVVYDPSAAYSVQLANNTDYLHLKPIPGYSIFKVRIAIQQTDVMQQFIYSGQVQLVVQVLNIAGPSQSVHTAPFVYLPLPYFYKYWTFHVGNYNLNGYEQTFPFLVADLHVNQLVQLWEQMTKAIMIPDAQVTNDDDKWNFQDAVGMGSDPAGIVTYTTTNGDSDTVDLSLVSSLVVDFGDAGCRVEVSRDQMIEHLTNQDVGNVNTDSVASNTTSGVLQLRCLNTTLYKDKLDIVLKNPDIPISSGNEFIFTIGVTLNYFSTVHPFMIQQHKQLTYQATNVGIRVIGVLNDNIPLTVVGIDPPQTSDVTASDTSSSDTLTPPVVSDPSATLSKNHDSSSLTTIVTLIVILVIAAGVGGFFIARRRAHQKHVNTPVADNSVVVDDVVTEQTQNNV